MQRKNIILSAVAIVAIILLVLYYNSYILLGLLLFIPFFLWRKFARKDEKAGEQPTFMTMDEVEKEYGQPDSNIVVDATRAYEPLGSIWVYRQPRILVVGGVPVSMDNIKEVTSVNMATPYTVGQYQLVLVMKSGPQEYIRLNVGYDAEWAMKVAAEVIEAIKR